MMRTIFNIKMYRVALACVLLLYGCKKENITLINRQVTPDLSNPVIQKLTENTWYITKTTEKWASTKNIPTPSESMANILYSAALRNITLSRDGSCMMVYAPPMFAGTFIYGAGTWTVSDTEENTIIIATKTPVGNSIFTMKVLYLETKDNVGVLKVTMDHRTRVYEQDFSTINNTYTDFPVLLEGIHYGWIEEMQVRHEHLQESEFAETGWANASRYSFTMRDFAREDLIGVTYIEDLLTKTPIFLYGVKFNLLKNGEARISYTDVSEFTGDGRKLYSIATWYTRGNKIMIHSDETLFLSVGENLFALPTYVPGLSLIKQGVNASVYLQSNRTFAIEIISKQRAGNWCRITTNDAIFYAFLRKESADTGDAINLKELMDK